ncbi:hypothetical protein ABW19_dt0200383 [Dactylella cylindrospora]|nr:hypothetical protein ABW19_dt0200383 [Dactylella cylindrospora]
MRLLLVLFYLTALVAGLPVGPYPRASDNVNQIRDPLSNVTPVHPPPVPDVEPRGVENLAADDNLKKRTPWVYKFRGGWKPKAGPYRGFYKRRSEGSYRHKDRSAEPRPAPEAFFDLNIPSVVTENASAVEDVVPVTGGSNQGEGKGYQGTKKGPYRPYYAKRTANAEPNPEADPEPEPAGIKWKGPKTGPYRPYYAKRTADPEADPEAEPAGIKWKPKTGPYRPYYAKRTAYAEASPEAESSPAGIKWKGPKTGPYRPYYSKRTASAEPNPAPEPNPEASPAGIKWKPKTGPYRPYYSKRAANPEADPVPAPEPEPEPAEIKWKGPKTGPYRPYYTKRQSGESTVTEFET